MSKTGLRPVHPGEVRLEEFLLPMHLSQNRLALDIGVPPRRITADTALRLGRYFRMLPQFWLGLPSIRSLIWPGLLSNVNLRGLVFGLVSYTIA